MNEYQSATFKYSGATRILTENQIRQVEQYGKFDGMEVDEKNKQIKSIRYDLLKTKGFYQLRNVVSGIQDVFNVYMFVGDASSPRSLYKINNGDDSEADVNVSDSLFLANDTMLFKNEKGDVGSCNLNSVYLPESVQNYIAALVKENQRPAYWNKWEMLFNTNLVYHANKTLPEEASSVNQSEDGKGIVSLFGGFNNPYEQTTIVYAQRRNYTQFNAYWNEASGSNNKHLYMILGLPSCMTWNGTAKKNTWRDKWSTSNQREKLFSCIKSGISELGRDDWLPEGTTTWMEVVYNYAHSDSLTETEDGYSIKVTVPGEEGDEELNVILSKDSAEWIDKHLCPCDMWNDMERAKQGKMTKYSLDEESIELFPMVLKPEGEEIYKFYDMTILRLCSSEALNPRIISVEKTSIVERT